MPESWFSEEQKERRYFNLVLANIVLQTKPQIASYLIDKIDKTKWLSASAR